MKSKFKRRCLLYLPASSEKMIAKAAALEVDGVILDLEDSVSPDFKNKARQNACDALRNRRASQCEQELIVRINQFLSPYALDDLLAICPLRPDALLIPKATRETVSAADIIIGMIELGSDIPYKSIALIPLIETPQAVEKVLEIIGTSDRVNAVQFGAEDYTKDMEITRTHAGTEIFYARNKIAIAAKIQQIDCLDTPFIDYKNIDECTKDTSMSKSLGMTGRTVIHPSVIKLTADIFTPSETELKRSREILTEYETALEQGQGAVSLNGMMVDKPIADKAKALLHKGDVMLKSSAIQSPD